MKKTVSLILALVLICTTLFGLTSCGSTEDTDKAVAEATAPLKAQIEALEKTISYADARIVALEAEKATLTAEKTALTEENATLKAKAAELEAKIAELEAEVARLKSALDGDTAALNAEIERLEGEIDTLKAEKTTLTARVNTLEGEVAELESTLAAKTSEIAGLNATVSSLKAEKNTLTARVAELESENASLKAENEKLKGESGLGLKEENAALKNCIKGIHTRGTVTNNNDGTHGYTCPICGTVVSEKHSFVNDICTGCGEDCYYARCDKDGTPNPNGDYILFGEYPQTIKADDVTIIENQDERGYYLGSDGEYYAKVIADPYESLYEFSTRESVIEGTVYYFKVEPIRWRILSEKNGEAFILCDSIISGHRFDDSSNNYAESEIRAWLNDTFYKTAFSMLQQSIILTAFVDNNVASTGYTSNRYACVNTYDKIFLLSVAEAMSNDYGFSSTTGGDKARYMVLSDYARALGAHMNTSSSYYGNGYWWLRSPSNGNSDFARYFIYDGSIINGYYVSNDFGVAPALRIRL